MRTYYLSILGLKDDASDEAIKKAYRKKALLYHPDKNTSSKSQEKFIEISKAYEYLLNKENQKLPYDENVLKETSQNFYDKRFKKEVTQETLDKLFERAKKVKKIKDFKEKNILEIGYHELKKSIINPISICVAGISFMIVLFLLLDFTILSPIEKHGIMAESFNDEENMNYYIIDVEASQRSKQVIKIHLTQDRNSRNYNYLRPSSGTPLLIYYTPILQEVKYIKSSANGKERFLHNSGGLYSLYYWYLFFLMLPAFTLFFRGPNEFYLIFAYLSTYLALIFLFIFSIHCYVIY